MPSNLQPVERAVLATDFHIGDDSPDHRAAIHLLLEFLVEVQPARFICLGDFFDFPTLSRWRNYSIDASGAPRTPDPASLRTELQTGARLWAYLRRILPNADLLWIWGNHDQHLARAIVETDNPIVGGFSAQLALPALCKLDSLRVRWVPWGSGEALWGWWLTHGGAGQSRSGVAAAEYKAWGRPVISGHVHRHTIHRVHTARGYEEAVTLPGLMNLHPAWNPTAAYEQGWAVLERYPDGTVTREIVQVRNGQAAWRGRVWHVALEQPSADPRPAPGPTPPQSTTPPAPAQWLVGTEAAAAAYNVNERTIRKWVAAGRITRRKQGGGWAYAPPEPHAA